MMQHPADKLGASADDIMAVADTLTHDDAVEGARTPLWAEARLGLEWMRLRMSSTYHGIDVPRGNGETVLLIPGFLCGDIFTLELRRWLARIGYKPAASRIVSNSTCPNSTLRQLIHRVNVLADASGQRISVIGHSLGGMLAKCLAQAVPDQLECTITMGSPIHAMVKAHPAIIGIWDHLRAVQNPLIGRNLNPSCGTGHCTCDFVRYLNVRREVRVRQYSIYSRTDGVVDWSSCQETDPTHNTEVCASHGGMACNVHVYRAIAQRLAEREKIGGNGAG